MVRTKLSGTPAINKTPRAASTLVLHTPPTLRSNRTPGTVVAQQPTRRVTVPKMMSNAAAKNIVDELAQLRNLLSGNVQRTPSVIETAKILDGRIEKFSGDGSLTIREWLSKLFDVLKRFGIPVDQARTIIPIYLTGLARVRYETIQNVDNLTFDQLKTELLRIMANPAAIEAARDELQTIKQGSESVGQFAAKIRTKAGVAYENMGAPYVERQMVDHFLRGVKADIKKSLRRQVKPASLAEIVELAEKEARILQQEREEEMVTLERINALNLEEKVNYLERKMENNETAAKNTPNNTMGNSSPSHNQTNKKKGKKNKSHSDQHYQQRGRGGPANYGRGRGRGGRGRGNYSGYGQGYPNPWNSDPNYQNYGYQNPNFGYQNPNFGYHNSNSQNFDYQNQNYAYDQTAVPSENYNQNTPDPSTSRGRGRGRGSPHFFPQANWFITLATLIFCMCSPVFAGPESQMSQICGFREGGQIIIPKLDQNCDFDARTIETEVQICEQRQPFKFRATKCSRLGTSMEVTSFFFRFWMKTTARNSSREAMKSDECMQMGSTHMHAGKMMKEIVKGVRVSEVETIGNDTIPWFGTSLITRKMVNSEEGTISSIDGNLVSSTLGEMSGCRLSDGFCKKKEYIIVWDKASIQNVCPFEKSMHTTALVSPTKIALRESGEILNFNDDITAKMVKSVESCNFENPQFTEEGHIVLIPILKDHTMVQDFDFTNVRSKREWVPVQDRLGRVSKYELVPKIPVPLKNRIRVLQISAQWNLTKITKKELLREVSFFNVTNVMLANRRKFYKGSAFDITLQTIRYAEYRMWQERKLAEIEKHRALNYGERELKRIMEIGVVDIFDSLLAQEFENVKVNYTHVNAEKAPYFDVDSLDKITSFDLGYQLNITEKPQVIHNITTSPPSLPISSKKIDSRNSQNLTTTSPETRTQPSTQNVQLSVEEIRKMVQNEVEQKLSGVRANQNFVPREAQSICLRYRSFIHIVRTFMEKDPTTAARLLLNRADVVAKHVGKSLLVSECEKVEITHTFWNRTINETCYEYVPVELANSNKTWFMKPGTNTLVESSFPIPCPAPQVVFQENGVWRTFDGEFQIQNIPVQAKSSISQSKFEQKVPIFFENFGSETKTRLYRAIDEKFSELVNALNLSEQIGNFVDTVKTKQQSVGKSLSEIYDNLMAEIDAGIDDFVTNILSIVLLILCSTIFIIFAAVASCCLIKWYCTKKLTKEAFELVQKSPKLLRSALSVNNVQFEEDCESIGESIEETEEDKFTGYKALCQAYALPEVYTIICNLQESKNVLPYLSAYLNQQPFKCLLDSGATVSYISLSTLRQLNLENDLNDSTNKVVARTANGSSFRFLGTIDLKVTIGRYQYWHRFKVSEDAACPAPALIGADFMRVVNEQGQRLSIDFLHRTVQVGNEISPLINTVEVEEDETETHFARLTETIVLPKRTESIVEVKLDEKHFNCGYEYLVEDSLRNDDQMYMVGRSLIQPKANRVGLIKIINPSATSVKLYKNTRIGIATEIQSNEQIFSVAVNQVQMSNEKIYVPPEAHWEQNLPHFTSKTDPNYDVSREIDLSKSSLTELQKEQLRNIIRKHSEAFIGADGKLGTYNGPIRHRIDLIDQAPVPAARVYRIPLEKRREVERQIEEMLNQNIIKQSDSPFSAPIVLVRKADKKSWRFTTDFRALNAITKPTQSVLPNIDDIIDLCSSQKYYSTMDFSSGFHQIPMEPEHTERTAFCCYLGTYEYLKMPMGLTTAPRTFQRVMNKLRKEVKARMFVYLDDLIVTSDTAEQHLEDLDEIFGKIEEIGMKLKPQKSLLARSEVKFLGFILSADGIRPNPEKTHAIDKYPTPKTVTEVRAFLGMTSFFRRFIANFSEIATPLVDLTRKDAEFVWSEKQETAFQKLKTALISAPILTAPKLGKPFLIETDASGVGIGAVLKQGEEGKEKVISYFSRTLNKHEQRYPAIELEALGLVAAVKKFSPYIDGAKCVVVTDHSPLKSLLYRKDLTGRLAKYQISLQEYNVEIRYKPGKGNVVADALSRHLPNDQVMTITINDLKLLDNITREEIAEEQKNCDSIRRLKTLLENKDDSEETDGFLLINDIVHRVPQYIGKTPQIMIPNYSNLRYKIIESIHESKFGCAHLGIAKTFAMIRNLCFWDNMREDVAIVVRNCATCQRNKAPNHYNTEPLQNFDVPQRPLQRVHADFVGPLPQTVHGNRYILVMVDSMTKFITAEALPDQKTATTVKAIIDRFVSKLGVPEILITDLGTNFMSGDFRKSMEALGVIHKTSTAYHHQCNGQVERMNRTLEELITQVTTDKIDEWDDSLQILVHAYNSAENSVTKNSPFFLMFGRQPNSPFHLRLGTPLPRYYDETSYVENLLRNLKSVWKLTAETVQKAQVVQKTSYDLRKKVKFTDYKVGNKVLIRQNRANKIVPLFSKPHSIVALDYPNLILKDEKGKVKTLHANQVKPFNE